jgi:hypothetical protein
MGKKVPGQMIFLNLYSLSLSLCLSLSLSLRVTCIVLLYGSNSEILHHAI